MIRRRTTAGAGPVTCLTLVVAWAALAAPEALAQEPTDSANEVAVQPQQTQSQAPTGQGQVGTWTYGARGSVSILSDDSLDPGFGVAGFAIYPFTTDLEVEAELGVQFLNTQADGIPKGRLTMFPVRGTVRVQLWRFGSAKPYAGAGAGIYFSNFSLDSEVEQSLNQLGFGASASVDQGLGLHAGGGVEWERGGWNIGVDVKYVFGELDAQSAIVDQVTGNVLRGTATLSLDGFWISFGARFSL